MSWSLFFGTCLISHNIYILYVYINNCHQVYCVLDNFDCYLSELIKQYHPSRNLRSQSKNLLSEIRVKSKTFGDRAFAKMAQKLWNNLPKNIRSITDFDKFKSMLKTHLFDNCISHLILKFHNLSSIFTFHTHTNYFYGIMHFQELNIIIFHVLYWHACYSILLHVSHVFLCL